MINIVIPTIGTRGDVQPYNALSLGLQKAGHDLTLASHPCMRVLVESYIVNFTPIGPDIDIGLEVAHIRAEPDGLTEAARLIELHITNFRDNS
jgi:sterol 3beta-glucosyltransferase